MRQREEKISKLLEFPYDAFLMVRLEYVQILGDELEAKLLRIIEKYIEQERTNIYQKMLNTAGIPPSEKVEITRDIWVPISYRLFKNDLFGTVTSENTIKRAIKNMINKKIIFQRFEPKKQYDAPEYKIHVNVLQMLLNVLKNPGYQNLIPSIVDTLKKLPPQELTPSECQNLIPSDVNSSSDQNLRVSTNDPHITEVRNNSTSITEERERVFVDTQTPPAFYASQEIPVTYNQALAYLAPHGPHEGLDAVQVMKLAQKLWTEAHETDSHSHAAAHTKLPARPTPIPFAEQAKAITDRRQTDPALPAVKPSQIPTSQSQARGTPDMQAPPASVGATAQVGAGQDLPPMALTAKQIKQQNERRAKDIWAIIERERQTKYSRTQRELYENNKGIECLLEDQIEDDTIIKALGAMDIYQRKQFTVLKFYGWLPNLTANESPPPQNGKQEPPVVIRPANKVRSFNGIAANS